jgi:predicted phosphodiesterase
MTGYKKIAIIADIHGNSWALENVLEDIQKRDISEILNLGDIFYGPLNPAKTYELVSKTKMTSISGNVDRYMMEVTLDKALTPTIPLSNPTMRFVIQSFDNESLQWLNKLPKTMIVNDNIFLCHGNLITDDSPLVEMITANAVLIKSDNELTEETNKVSQPVILCAHTHIGRFTNLSNGKKIINPGSVGFPAYTHDSPFQHKMESFSPHAKYCIIEMDGNCLVSVEHISLKYDWNSAINTAKENSRPDWAVWLTTGRA